MAAGSPVENIQRKNYGTLPIGFVRLVPTKNRQLASFDAREATNVAFG